MDVNADMNTEADADAEEREGGGAEVESDLSAAARSQRVFHNPTFDGEPAADEGAPAECDDERVQSGLLASGRGETDDGEGGRGRWGSHAMFVLAAISAAIGLGNVWRFPYLCYRFGGGSFLVPYAFALVFVGLPILAAELAMGQQFQRGAMESMRILHVRAWGVGLMAAVGAVQIVWYYHAIMSWCWVFLYHSFTADLPWAGGLSPANEFFYQDVLGSCIPGQEGCKMEGRGGLEPPLVLGLLASTLCTYLCVFKGVASTGWAAYVTVPLPVLLLVVLFFRGVTLEGAGGGVAFYLTPDFKDLVDPLVWINAMSQIFFSTSVASGIMIAYGSYLPKEVNIARDAAIIGCTNSACSVLSGFVVFSIIGHLAAAEGVAVGDVVDAGPGLTFVVFPAAIALIPAAPVISVLFFTTLLLLGLGSAFGLVAAFNTVLYDCSPWCRAHKQITAAGVLGSLFLLGLLMATPDGRFWIDIVDHFVSDYVLTIVGLVEVIVLGWIYGPQRLEDLVMAGSGTGMPRGWGVIIKYVDPVVIGGLLLYNTINEGREVYGSYPPWAVFVGWLSLGAAGGWALVGAARPMRKAMGEVVSEVEMPIAN